NVALVPRGAQALQLFERRDTQRRVQPNEKTHFLQGGRDELELGFLTDHGVLLDARRAAPGKAGRGEHARLAGLKYRAPQGSNHAPTSYAFAGPVSTPGAELTCLCGLKP